MTPSDQRPLADLLGFDVTALSPRQPAPMPVITGLLVRHEPPQPWETYEMPPAPSWLAPVKMPDAHLSIQIAWFHRLIAQGKARQRKEGYRLKRARARATKRPHTPTPEELEILKARRAEYMRRYRKKRALARAAMRGAKLTPLEKALLVRHQKRVEKLRRNRKAKRRKELRDAYRAALLRDQDRARAVLLNLRDKTP